MSIFKWFDSLWNNLKWLINFVYVYVSPIYKELVVIIKEVQDSDLEDEAARKQVFQDITDYIQTKGLDRVPDSILNCIIEMVFQLIKQKKA